MKPLSLFNTVSRTVEEFRPANPPVVTFYSCGPTVYLPQHLGNMRAYVFVDTLKRVLVYNGYDVRHVMNVTDVGHMTSDEDAGEDKIEKTARLEGKPPLEIANEYLALFESDCRRLNIEPPTVQCRATDHIPEMIALIEKILARGYGYVTPSAVYFDVEKWRGPSRIGRLSRQSLDEQHTGQRLEHSPDKHSPHDFALWVLDQPHHMMQWDSPWGRGYPGWHIECSAMSMKYLGATLDIHSGGLDHIPVHHENEIAQSESATAQPFVRYFVHNAFLVGMEGAKISKSAGKFPVVADLLAEGIDPIAFRWLCFMAKYRSELMFSTDSVKAAENSLLRLYNFVADLPRVVQPTADAPWVKEYLDRFEEAVNDDLNTPQGLAAVFEMLAKASKDKDGRVWAALRKFDAVLGVGLEEADEKIVVSESSENKFDRAALKQAKERLELRRQRQFKDADAVRDQILASGYKIEDLPGGNGFRLKRRWKHGISLEP